MRFLRIKNWSEFQHYKDRDPAWIKLHKKLLDNYDFQTLPLASKALAPMLWLLASEYKEPSAGLIEENYPKMAFRLRCTEQEIREAIKPLITNGFIELYQDASEPLAEPEQPAMPENIVKDIGNIDQEETDARATDAFVEMQFETFFHAYPGFNKGKISEGQKGTKEEARPEFRRAARTVDPEHIIAQAHAYGNFLKKTNGIAKAACNWLAAKGWETNYALRDTGGRTPMPSPAGG